MNGDTVRLVFLGTGASGGTPGRGRSQRLESSLLVRGSRSVLIDATRDFTAQSEAVGRIDLLLLTHAHRDAAGGVPALRRWWAHRRVPPIPTLAHPGTFERLRERHRRLDHLEMVPVLPGETTGWFGWTITVAEVPHAADALRFPTYAWRLQQSEASLVYASDVAALTADLARLVDGASVLVLDGAMWGRTLFAHLRADQALPEVCRWPVQRILLTQIGKSAPAHHELVRLTRWLCPRARPAYDGQIERL